MKKKISKIFNKKIVLLIVSILTVIIILMNSTYSLLMDTKKTGLQSYTTGILEITSSTTNNSVTLTNGIPMSDADGANSKPYTFKIKNTGNLIYTFDIKLLSTTATNLIDAQYIKIKVNDNEVQTLSTLTEGKILEGITLEPYDTMEVTLRVWLDYNTPNSQIGKVFNAKIVTEGYASYTASYTPEQVLSKLGLSVSSGIPNFSNSSCSSGCNESTVGIYPAADDFGTSYYFRGDVTNNYVKFGVNENGQDMYWRIIRINGDGTVRMIYMGTDINATSLSTVGTSKYNNDKNDNTFVGYMYGDAGQSTYDLTHSNKYDSAIKIFLEGTSINDYTEGWYYKNIVATGYHEYVADAIYCNDRSIGPSGTEMGTTDTYYRAHSSNVTLKCAQKNDRFTKNDNIGAIEGNAKLKYPVGLITSDEVKMAGGGSSNTKYYLYSSNSYWTMTPYRYSSGSGSNVRYVYNGYTSYEGVNEEKGIIPVISLKSNALKTGAGSKTTPYSVEEFLQEVEYDYFSAAQTYKITKNGTYKLEAWGAQGTSYNSTYTGGKGGYISGTITLNKNDVLTITTGGQNGTNGGGTGANAGGGATTIKLNGITIMTAAGGGGAAPTGSGTAGGSGNGAGGVSVGAGAGTAGTNGGGGSSSPDYKYNCVETNECKEYNHSSCFEITHNYCDSHGCCANTVPNDGTCTVECSSQIDSSWIATTIWGGTPGYEKTFDTPCYEYYEECDITYGKPGNGGTSSIGSGVTLITKTDGNNEGNGHAKISFVS